MSSGWAIGAVDLARRRSDLAEEAEEAVGREAFDVIVLTQRTGVALRFGNRTSGFDVFTFAALQAGSSAHLLVVLACRAACTVRGVVVEAWVRAIVSEVLSFVAVGA